MGCSYSSMYKLGVRVGGELGGCTYRSKYNGVCWWEGS